MKRLSLLALALAGCSSSAAPGYSPPGDSGNPFADADAAADTSQPGDATPDSASSETSDAADAAPEAAEDSQAGDATSDSAEVGDAAVDAPGDAADAAEAGDAAVDPAALERARCEAGGPRLAWWSSISSCVDTSTVYTNAAPSFACSFRVASDGQLRCLPRLAGPVGGYSSGCSAIYLDSRGLKKGSYPREPVAVREGATETLYQGTWIANPANWYRFVSSSCTKASGAFPYSTDSTTFGDVLQAQGALDPAAFSKATL